MTEALMSDAELMKRLSAHPELRSRMESLLLAVEDEAGLSLHRAPDPSFVAVAYAWAAGGGFEASGCGGTACHRRDAPHRQSCPASLGSAPG